MFTEPRRRNLTVVCSQPAGIRTLEIPRVESVIHGYRRGHHKYVVVVGTVRRRFFRAGGATQSRTEVLADKVVRASRTRAAQKLVESVVALLDAA